MHPGRAATPLHLPSPGHVRDQGRQCKEGRSSRMPRPKVASNFRLCSVFQLVETRKRIACLQARSTTALLNTSSPYQSPLWASLSMDFMVACSMLRVSMHCHAMQLMRQGNAWKDFEQATTEFLKWEPKEALILNRGVVQYGCRPAMLTCNPLHYLNRAEWSLKFIGCFCTR